MKALVVGLGSIGRRHARNWARLGLGEVLVCRSARQPLPEPPGIEAREFGSLEDALNERPDVVLVTNPTSLHMATAVRALEAGAHVLVEKPISHSLEGVERLQESKHEVMVGYNLRFHPGLQRLRQLLKAGAVGKPLSVRADVGEYLPDWHPWEDYRASYSGRRDLGGGPVLTFSHEIDTVYWLLGMPSRVTAAATHASALEIDTEDIAEIVLSYPDGALASIHVDYVRRPTRRQVEVVGEAGTLCWEFEANRLLRYAPATREWIVEQGDPRFERNDMFMAELCEFAARARGDTRDAIGADARQGIEVLKVALGALRSAGEGRRIALDG
jgi:predicted dehydrogenase